MRPKGAPRARAHHWIPGTIESLLTALSRGTLKLTFRHDCRRFEERPCYSKEGLSLGAQTERWRESGAAIADAELQMNIRVPAASGWRMRASVPGWPGIRGGCLGRAAMPHVAAARPDARYLLQLMTRVTRAWRVARTLGNAALIRATGLRPIGKTHHRSMIAIKFAWGKTTATKAVISGWDGMRSHGGQPKNAVRKTPPEADIKNSIA
jgi:hypothetical protein